MEFVNVIVDISHEKLDRIFQYHVPEELKDRLQIGMKVNVPFGKGNRLMKGYVVGFADEADYPPDRIKELSGIVEGSVKAESQLIAMAGWMRDTYGSTMNQALKTVLPVKRQVVQKQSRKLTLQIPREEAETLLEEYLRKNYRAKARLMAALLDLDKEGLDYKKASEGLKIAPSVIKRFQEEGLVQIKSETVYRNPAVVLIPEIALTFQTVTRFYERFGERVSVMHSRLSDGERFDQFMRAKEGGIDVMIGPRSALFTPFSQIGVIIMDEEHEGSYKSENVPRYHAREAAVFRARMCGASVILGSATPSMESYYRARSGVYGLYRLNKRIGGAGLPKVSVVDLRTELKEGNRSIFSRRLMAAMEERLQKRQQIMLFLNRRGLSGFVSCRSCGKAIQCPHCDVTLSLHNDGRLKCHYCGYETGLPPACPSCGSKYISGFRAGTQQIEREVNRIFPRARVLRMDYDTTRTKESYEQILTAFGREEADVLVGTQMIVKGHDFPNVTLVGILAADISLYAADYRASERTFQLLAQAAGRAGRGREAGEALIQTYMPEHYSIRTASKQDYEEFYRQELMYRNLMEYPPVFSMLGIYLSSKDEELLKKQAQRMGDCIRKRNVKKLTVVGPADAALSRKNDVYRKVIYLKHAREDVLLGIKNSLEKEMEKEAAVWQKLYIQFDYNPLNAY